MLGTSSPDLNISMVMVRVCRIYMKLFFLPYSRYGIITRAFLFYLSCQIDRVGNYE